MKKYSIKKYSKDDFKKWNDFVLQTKNGTFLHNRNFMEYHQDRFEDFSLIILENEKWVAVLPANVYKNEVFSHQGLTYGGLLYSEKLKLVNVIEIFQIILFFFNEIKIEKLVYKLIPNIYYQKPAEEIKYALFLTKSKLIRCDTLSVIDLSKEFKIASGRLEGIKKGTTNNLEIREENNFEDFWKEILIPNLFIKHRSEPVHSVDEIKLLKKIFPENIRQFNVYQNNKIVAGTTIFETNLVAHSQYISGNESKSQNGSLDFLYHYLITDFYRNKKFLDFGTSNENNGQRLNSGLNFWKESFGSNTIVQEFYETDTKNYNLLSNFLSNKS